MTTNNELLQLVYKSRTNILNYAKQLQFNSKEYDNFNMNEINHMIKTENLDMELNNEKMLYIKYHILKALRVQYIEEIIDDLYNIEEKLNDTSILILIAKDKINDTIKNYLSKLYVDRNIYIIHFSLAELQFNVLDHCLVPKHSILSKADAKAFKEKYNITNINQVPEISRYDAAGKCIFIKPGDIVKIERSSKNAIISEYFRHCINK